jgi:CubicO group peptidase (beta-lactamase class C family)
VLASDIARHAQPLIDGGIAPTLAIGVIDGDATHRFEHGADPRALFEIGSITKVFTGTLLADMVREGLVAFDDPVSRYLPASVRVPTFGDRAITLSDLVTHASGLPRMPTNFAPADPRDPYADYTTAKLYAFLAGHTLARAPGEKSEYSNLGMMLLGHALAERAGKSYEELLRERICEPLGMRDTVLTLTPELRARVAKGYDALGKVAANWTMALPGAGNILSTVDDMLRFLTANMTSGPARLAASMADARRQRTAIDPAPPVPIGAVGLGCGWVVGRGDVRWHNGGSAGYVSFAAVDGGKRHAVVALCGTFSTKLDELGNNLMRVLDGEAPVPPRVPVPVPIDPSLLGPYVGKYTLPSGAVLSVTEREGRLFAQRNDEEAMPLYAASESRFFYRVAPIELSFVVGRPGEGDHIIVHADQDRIAKKLA